MVLMGTKLLSTKEESRNEKLGESEVYAKFSYTDKKITLADD